MGLQQSGPSSQNMERVTAWSLDTIVYYTRDSSRSMDPENGLWKTHARLHNRSASLQRGASDNDANAA